MLMRKIMEIYRHTCWKKISGKCASFFSFTTENHLTFIFIMVYKTSIRKIICSCNCFAWKYGLWDPNTLGPDVDESNLTFMKVAFASYIMT